MVEQKRDVSPILESTGKFFRRLRVEEQCKLDKWSSRKGHKIEFQAEGGVWADVD